MSRISADLLTTFDKIQNHLGEEPGDYYPYVDDNKAIEGVHDGRILVRMGHVRVVLVDYGIHPTLAERREAYRLSHVRILEGAGSQECSSPDCFKVGVPVVLYDSHPQETLVNSILFKNEKCFTCCAKSSASSKRHRLRPTQVTASTQKKRALAAERKAALKIAVVAKGPSTDVLAGTSEHRKQSPSKSSSADAGARSDSESTEQPLASMLRSPVKKKVKTKKTFSRVPAQRSRSSRHVISFKPPAVPRKSPPSASSSTKPKETAQTTRALALKQSTTELLSKMKIPPTEISESAKVILTELHDYSDFEPPAVVNHGQQIEFSLQPILQHLVCQFCHGLFRDPFTITGCRHTFCRSCILIAHAHSEHACPTCHAYMGKDLTKFAVPDRILQDLIDKVLFPDINERELAEEAAFYKSMGIRRKPHAPASADAKEPLLATTVRPNAVQVRFELLPAPGSNLPGLECPILETQGTIRIVQLKRYLEMKVPKLNVKDPANDLEIVCNDLPLGNELSVTFIMRTIWMEKDEDSCLTLVYRKRSTTGGNSPTAAAETPVAAEVADTAMEGVEAEG